MKTEKSHQEQTYTIGNVKGSSLRRRKMIPDEYAFLGKGMKSTRDDNYMNKYEGSLSYYLNLLKR